MDISLKLIRVEEALNSRKLRNGIREEAPSAAKELGRGKPVVTRAYLGGQTERDKPESEAAKCL